MHGYTAYYSIGVGIFPFFLLLVYGIASIVKSVSSHEYGLDFVFGILSVILGIIIMLVPGLKAMTTGILIYIMAGWFVVQGIVDTMKDLLVNFVGAVVLSIVGMLFLKDNGKGKLAASLIPQVKETEKEMKL